jgi:parallel beta-helix repeat protein
MSLGKKPAVLIVSLIVLIATLSPTAEAKSVYVVADTGTLMEDIPVIQAYDIEDANLVLQAEYQTVHPLAIGLAIDPQSGFMFVTHEETNKIEIVNAKALRYVDTVTAAEAANLAGIVYDQTKQKVYVVDRGKKYLYLYKWYPNVPELVQDGNRVELEGLVDNDVGGAWGIALDETNHRLWVTSNQMTVRFYDSNDNWSHDPNTDYITVSHRAVGIAVDIENQYVYTGRSQAPPTLPPITYLSQYDLSADPNTAETTVNVGSRVIGITVDRHTSLIYLTTYGDIGDSNYADPPRDRLMIYDANLDKQQWESGDIGNPADVQVAGEVSYKPPLLKLEKTDGAGPDNRPAPGDYITYTISYDANGHDVNNVLIIDHLPDEIGPNDVNASDSGSYDSNTHTVTWDLNDLDGSDFGSVTLTVRIKPDAPTPLETIINFCEMESDSSYNAAYCVTPDVIYADPDATGGDDNGRSWQNAYTHLQDGLDRSTSGRGSRIWVADGTYIPTKPPGYDATFKLVEGIALYGGFTGNETSLTQRNYISNETTLNGNNNSNQVVTGAAVTATATIDGFIISNAVSSGIYCNTGSPTIANCKIANNYEGILCESSASPHITDCNIQNNEYHGIECINSDASVSRSIIKSNGGSGIASNSSNLNITNSILHHNSDHGLNIYQGQPTIRNNWIHHNGTDGSGYGIYLNDVHAQTSVHNNTIAHNDDYGVRASSVNPTISNCIIWANGVAGLSGTFNSVTYSCIQGEPLYSGEGNINTDPLFVDDGNDNYHLISPNSPCIDAGTNAGVDPNEKDIDGEMRIVDGDGNGTKVVDMGADEYYRSGADFNADGIVNFVDYDILASAWGRSSGDPNYNDVPDLNDNNSIDNNDLRLFCADWLWIAGWTKSPEEMMMMGCGMGGMQMPLAEELHALESPEDQPTPAYQTESQPSPPPELDDAQIEELIQWLEEILEDELTREQIGEQDWDNFVDGINYIIDCLKQEL